MTPQVERDAHLTQTYWMEIRHIVKKIYREKLSLTSKWREGEGDGERVGWRESGMEGEMNNEKDDKERGRREREEEREREMETGRKKIHVHMYRQREREEEREREKIHVHVGSIQCSMCNVLTAKI